ncbi:MAG: hypothetical protein ABFC24_04835 [Methanoregulaceae archaeon]
MPVTISPLRSLVLCMVVLSVFGALIGGLHWYAVDLPQQKAVQAPAKGVCGPHYNSLGQLIGITCCDEYGNPEVCHTVDM